MTFSLARCSATLPRPASTEKPLRLDPTAVVTESGALTVCSGGYDRASEKLAGRFAMNFEAYADAADDAIAEAGPPHRDSLKNTPSRLVCAMPLRRPMQPVVSMGLKTAAR